MRPIKTMCIWQLSRSCRPPVATDSFPLHLAETSALVSTMGGALLVLSSLALGAAAQTTAGAYGQCKTSVCLALPDVLMFNL